jgi:hypothetical protein
VARIDDNTSVAYFGYRSDYDFSVELPIGDANRFSPLPSNRGQPTVFQPGRSSSYPNPAFSVSFSSSLLVWTLDGRTVTASRNANSCDQLNSPITEAP